LKEGRKDIERNTLKTRRGSIEGRKKECLTEGRNNLR
jgi:hypothetical protein